MFTTVKLIFLKHGSNLSLPYSEPSNGSPLSSELSQMFPSILFQSHYVLFPALVLYFSQCEQSLFTWIHFRPCSHLTPHRGKSRLYHSLIQRVSTFILRDESPSCGHPLHMPPSVLSQHLISFSYSGLYWVWIMSDYMQFKPSSLFYILKSMRSKSLC